MYIVSSFKHSLYLELALTDLEQNGIPKSQILAVPLAKKPLSKSMRDMVYGKRHSDLDIPMALGTAGSVVWGAVGFILEWGPIIWGIIGFFLAGFVGYVLDRFFNKKKQETGDKGTEVFVLIHCTETEAATIEQLLWNHKTLGMAFIKNLE